MAVSFLMLPAEIRNKIYKYSLRKPFQWIQLYPRPRGIQQLNSSSQQDSSSLSTQNFYLGAKPRSNLPRLSTALLSTCRQVHDEAIAFLYKNVYFEYSFYEPYGNDEASSFLQPHHEGVLPQQSLQHIENLDICAVKEGISLDFSIQVIAYFASAGHSLKNLSLRLFFWPAHPHDWYDPAKKTNNARIFSMMSDSGFPAWFAKSPTIQRVKITYHDATPDHNNDIYPYLDAMAKSKAWACTARKDPEVLDDSPPCEESYTDLENWTVRLRRPDLPASESENESDRWNERDREVASSSDNDSSEDGFNDDSEGGNDDSEDGDNSDGEDGVNDDSEDGW